MAQEAMLNVPLPMMIYLKLKEEALNYRKSEAAIVRDAIENWLKQRERKTLDQEIANYAQAHAGSEVDLDEELELASIEHLLEEGSDL